MIKTKYIFAILALVGLMSCTKDDSVDYTEYYERRDLQDQFANTLLNKQRSDSALTYFNQKVMSLTEPVTANNKNLEFRRYVYYHVVEACDTAKLIENHRFYRPYYTSTLKAHYTLYNTDTVMARFDKAKALYGNDFLHNKKVMDAIFMDVPKKVDPQLATMKADTLESYQVQFFENFKPSSVVEGWGCILQNMYEGDSYVLCIPWFLGYGQAGSGGTIKPYTNLFFRLQLVEITKLGAPVDRVDKE